METYIKTDTATVYHGDCREVLKTLPDNSVDSVVTDPPYELGFMGKSWDASGIAYNADLWRECLRVLKPGGHLLAFGGSRTIHRIAVAIEDAGFEIRDSIHWTYGSGFPKSMNVAKAIEGLITTGSSNKKDFKNLSGEQVERGNWGIAKAQQTHGQRETNYDMTAGETRLGELTPTTTEAQTWQGWGTALKPSHEPIVVARKPLIGTVASNVLTYGTGGLNIDGTRVGSTVETWPASRNYSAKAMSRPGSTQADDAETQLTGPAPAGRWPANTIITHSPDCEQECAEGCPVVELDRQSGVSKSAGGRIGKKAQGSVTNVPAGQYETGDPGYGDTGGASRYFTQTTYTEADYPAFLYYAKASKRERNQGLEHLPSQRGGGCDR